MSWKFMMGLENHAIMILYAELDMINSNYR